MTDQTVIDDQAFIVTEQELISVVAAGIQGPPGPPGADSEGSKIEFYFNFGDVAEQIIGTIQTSQLLRVRIDVLTAFNAVGVDATIGTTSNPSQLLPSGFIDLSQAGTFDLVTNLELSVDTQYKLFFTTGSGGTQGRGVIRIYFDL